MQIEPVKGSDPGPKKIGGDRGDLGVAEAHTGRGLGREGVGQLSSQRPGGRGDDPDTDDDCGQE